MPEKFTSQCQNENCRCHREDSDPGGPPGTFGGDLGKICARPTGPEPDELIYDPWKKGEADKEPVVMNDNAYTYVAEEVDTPDIPSLARDVVKSRDLLLQAERAAEEAKSVMRRANDNLANAQDGLIRALASYNEAGDWLQKNYLDESGKR